MFCRARRNIWSNGKAGVASECILLNTGGAIIVCCVLYGPIRNCEHSNLSFIHNNTGLIFLGLSFSKTKLHISSADSETGGIFYIFPHHHHGEIKDVDTR